MHNDLIKGMYCWYVWEFLENTFPRIVSTVYHQLIQSNTFPGIHSHNNKAALLDLEGELSHSMKGADTDVYYQCTLCIVIYSTSCCIIKDIQAMLYKYPTKRTLVISNSI